MLVCVTGICSLLGNVGNVVLGDADDDDNRGERGRDEKTYF